MTAKVGSRLIYRWLLFAAIMAIGGFGAWYFFVRDDVPSSPDSPEVVDTPPADPRLTFATPFRNVKPNVQYVGDSACATCHQEIDKNYHAHPMGRSAEFTAKASPIERYDAAAHNPFTVGPYE